MKFAKHIGCPCFTLVLFSHFVRSVLYLNDSQKFSDDLIGMNIQTVSAIIENKQCVNIRTYGDIIENIISSMFQKISVPFITGKLHTICKQTIVITENEKYINEFVPPDNLGIKSVILMLDMTCPGPNTKRELRKFVEIFILCFMSNSVYELDVRGEISRILDTSTFLPVGDRNFINFKGKFLRVSTFNCPTFSYGTEGGLKSSSSDIHHLDGIEMKIFIEISERLNFSWKLQEPPEINKWGQKWSNGTWSGGIVGALVDGRADVGFCCLWVSSPQAVDIDLTYPWSILCNTFIAPRPRRLDKFGAIFSPFQHQLWFLLTATILLISSVLWCLERIRRLRVTGVRVHDMNRHVLDILGILTLASLSPPSEKLEESRHVVTWWAVFVLLITTAYSSSLVSHLTVPLFEPPLDSVRDLVVSNIQWKYPYFPALDVIFDLQNPWHLQFISNLHVDPLTAKPHHSYPTRDYAALGFVLEGEDPYFLQGNPMNPSALPSFRVMKECVSRYYISLGLSRNSPYTMAFNQVLLRLIETGIVQHWKESISVRRMHPEMSQLFQDDEGKPSTVEPLRFENIQGAFFLLIFGLILGIGMFCLEKCFNARMQVMGTSPKIIGLTYNNVNQLK